MHDVDVMPVLLKTMVEVLYLLSEAFFTLMLYLAAPDTAPHLAVKPVVVILDAENVVLSGLVRSVVVVPLAVIVMVCVQNLVTSFPFETTNPMYV